MFKKIFAALLILTFIAIPSVSANDLNEEEQNAVDNVGESLQRELDKDFGIYKDEDTYYGDLDLITHEERQNIDEENSDDSADYNGPRLNPFSIIGGFVSDKAEDVSGNTQDALASAFMFIVNAIWGFNIMMSEAMLTMLNVSMENDVIKMLIVLAENMVSSISGIEGNNVQTEQGIGIFGTLVPIFSVIVVAYMVYKFFVKRSALSGLTATIHPIIALTFAIFFMTNMGFVLNTLNNTATEVTNVVSTSTSEDTETLADSIHEMFVHRPYLYMQFNTGNAEDIGKGSIETMLLNSQNDGEKRGEIQEQYANGNQMMTFAGIVDRFKFGVLFFFGNAVMSIPVWALAMLMFGLQLLLIVVAMASPFYLVFSMLPGQFGVLINYLKVLLMPLALKIFLSFIGMVIFTLSNIAYSIPGTSGVGGYILTVFIQGTLFFLAFIFRKQIFGIFKTSKGFVRDMFESSRIVEAPKERAKDIVGSGVKAGTTTAGYVMGGPTGAQAGYQAGQMAQNHIKGNPNQGGLINADESQQASNANPEPSGQSGSAGTQELAPKKPFADQMPSGGPSNNDNQPNIDTANANEGNTPTGTDKHDDMTTPDMNTNDAPPPKAMTTKDNYKFQNEQRDDVPVQKWENNANTQEKADDRPNDMPLISGGDSRSNHDNKPSDMQDPQPQQGNASLDYTVVNGRAKQKFVSIKDYESREKRDNAYKEAVEEKEDTAPKLVKDQDD